MKGWHFLPANGSHRYDKRTPKQGETLSIPDNETPRLRWTGLHASKRLIDALNYAPGPLIQRVDVTGDLDIGNNKFCGRHRTTLAGPIDATDTLRRFARLCALDVIHLWDPPDVVVQYLKTGDESIKATAQVGAWDAARYAAGYAAGDAAWDAARYAARYAARAAAGDAARSAAWDAAWSAAWDAAWSAAGDAAQTKQNRRLTAMISRLLKEAK